MAEVLTQVGVDVRHVFEGDAWTLRPVTFTSAKPRQLVAPQPAALIGYVPNSPVAVAIGDLERRSGVYISGRSGTGKTTAIESLLAHDLRQGHGVFFLDPHGDAIENVLRFADMARLQKDVLLLDFEDPTHTFGINPLACEDINDWEKRNKAYDHARTLFYKIFERENAPGDKPWLEEVIAYTFQVLIENPDYTMAEIPEFLKNAAFREHILGNVRHNWQAVGWWKRDFDEKKMEAAISRISLLINDPRIAHIIGQKKTTVNFAEIMAEKC